MNFLYLTFVLLVLYEVTARKAITPKVLVGYKTAPEGKTGRRLQEWEGLDTTQIVAIENLDALSIDVITIRSDAFVPNFISLLNEKFSDIIDFIEQDSIVSVNDFGSLRRMDSSTPLYEEDFSSEAGLLDSSESLLPFPLPSAFSVPSMSPALSSSYASDASDEIISTMELPISSSLLSPSSSLPALLEPSRVSLSHSSPLLSSPFSPDYNYHKRMLLGSEFSLPLKYASYNAEAGMSAAQFEDVKMPNDTLFGHQWHLYHKQAKSINLLHAWEYIELATGSKNLQDTLAPVIVAVIDTGVDYNHKELKGRIWVNDKEIPDNGIDDDNNGYVDDYYGYDFLENKKDPMDLHGHGTHSAGTIAAVANNGRGIAGIAPNAKVMCLKFMDEEGFGVVSDAVRALDYAIKMGAKISSNSWGGHEMTRSLQLAVEQAQKRNVLIIASAGNAGKSTAVKAYYPAALNEPNIISVGASDQTGNISDFSNYGNDIQLFAPGDEIASLWKKNAYYIESGTSMSTSIVAGVAALLQGVDESLRPVDIKSLLLSTATHTDELSTLNASSGILDALGAVNKLFIGLDTIRRMHLEQDDGTIATSALYSLAQETRPLSSPPLLSPPQFSPPLLSPPLLSPPPLSPPLSPSSLASGVLDTPIVGNTVESPALFGSKIVLPVQQRGNTATVELPEGQEDQNKALATREVAETPPVPTGRVSWKTKRANQDPEIKKQRQQKLQKSWIKFTEWVSTSFHSPAPSA